MPVNIFERTRALSLKKREGIKLDIIGNKNNRSADALCSLPTVRCSLPSGKTMNSEQLVMSSFRIAAYFR